MVRSTHSQEVLFYLSAIRRFKKNVEEKKRERKENNSDNIKVHLAIFDMIMKLENTVSQAGLEVPPTRAQVGYVGEKTQVRIRSSSLQSAGMGGLDAPTYPTWSLVGGTSRPAGKTVYV